MTDDIKVPGGIVKAGAALGAVVVFIGGALVGFNAHFVSRTEWQQAETRESQEVQETAKSLDRHVEQTRLDAVRLGAIEVQLVALREDLAWFRRRLERDPQKAVK
jgi:molecular chaperone GrpE (heat shock protein)